MTRGQLKQLIQEVIKEIKPISEFRYSVQAKKIVDLEKLIVEFVNFFARVVTSAVQNYDFYKRRVRDYIEQFDSGVPSYHDYSSRKDAQIMELARIWVKVGGRTLEEYDRYLPYIDELFIIEVTSRSKQEYDEKFMAWKSNFKDNIV